MSTRAQLEKQENLGQALTKIEDALFRFGLHGLQRLTRSSTVELKALATSAHTGGLIRIERQIEAMATLAERYLERDPLFSSGAWIAAVNRLWLLVRATRARYDSGQELDAMIDLVGEARRSYVELDGPVVIEAICASGWVTDTDYVGVTVHFAVKGRPGELFTASNARPSLYFGNNPRDLLNVWMSDYLHLSVGDLAHGAFELVGAKVSADKRLSLHRNLVVKPAPMLGAEAWAPFRVARWTDALERLRGQELNLLDGAGREIVYVQPEGFGPLVYDRVHQRAHAVLTDHEGNVMRLEVPMRPENNFLLDALEAMLDPFDPMPLPVGLVGALTISNAALCLFPWTALYDEPQRLDGRHGAPVNAVHLSLESIRK